MINLYKDSIKIYVTMYWILILNGLIADAFDERPQLDRENCDWRGREGHRYQHVPWSIFDLHLIVGYPRVAVKLLPC